MCERYIYSAHLIMWPHPARSWQQRCHGQKVKRALQKKPLVAHMLPFISFRPWRLGLPGTWCISLSVCDILHRGVWSCASVSLYACKRLSHDSYLRAWIGSVSVESLLAPLNAHSMAGSASGQIWKPYCICICNLYFFFLGKNKLLNSTRSNHIL